MPISVSSTTPRSSLTSPASRPKEMKCRSRPSAFSSPGGNSSSRLNSVTNSSVRNRPRFSIARRRPWASPRRVAGMGRIPKPYWRLDGAREAPARAGQRAYLSSPVGTAPSVGLAAAASRRVCGGFVAGRGRPASPPAGFFAGAAFFAAAGFFWPRAPAGASASSRGARRRGGLGRRRAFAAGFFAGRRGFRRRVLRRGRRLLAPAPASSPCAGGAAGFAAAGFFAAVGGRRASWPSRAARASRPRASWPPPVSSPAPPAWPEQPRPAS